MRRRGRAARAHASRRSTETKEATTPTLPPSPPGRATGEAYAAFASPDAAASALEERQRALLGARYVELFPEPGADPTAPPTGRPLAGGLSARVVRLRGLPFAGTPADVVEFCVAAGAGPPCAGGRGVVFTATPDGRPTGEAYVEFESDAAADAALAAHGRPLGPRYVEVFASCRGELLHAARARAACARRRPRTVGLALRLPRGRHPLLRGMARC